jgi:hypothetical protein
MVKLTPQANTANNPAGFESLRLGRLFRDIQFVEFASPGSDGLLKSISMRARIGGSAPPIIVRTTEHHHHTYAENFLYYPNSNYCKDWRTTNFGQRIDELASAISERPNTGCMTVVLMSLPVFEVAEQVPGVTRALPNLGATLPNKLAQRGVAANSVMCLSGSDPRIKYLAERANLTIEKMIDKLTTMYIAAGFDAVLIESRNGEKTTIVSSGYDTISCNVFKRGLEVQLIPGTLSSDGKSAREIMQALANVLEVANMSNSDIVQKPKSDGVPTNGDPISVVFANESALAAA